MVLKRVLVVDDEENILTSLKGVLEDEGFEVPVFTGGGTGTYNIDSEIGAITDLQAGSYLFMDIEYRDIGGIGSEHFTDFEPSLFVLATAISKPQDRLITVDAGIKSLATDTAYPEFRDVEGVVYHFGGDEHGICGGDERGHDDGDDHEPDGLHGGGAGAELHGGEGAGDEWWRG